MEDSLSECAIADVHIRILLPDGSSLLLNIKRYCTAIELYMVSLHTSLAAVSLYSSFIV